MSGPDIFWIAYPLWCGLVFLGVGLVYIEKQLCRIADAADRRAALPEGKEKA